MEKTPLPTEAQQEMIKAITKEGDWETKSRIISRQCSNCHRKAPTYLIRSNKQLMSSIKIECENPRCWRRREHGKKTARLILRKADAELIETHKLTAQQVYEYGLLLLRMAHVSPEEIRLKDTTLIGTSYV